MIRINSLNHFSFYLLGLVILVIGLPWSPFLISLSQAVLLVNWILEGDFHRKFTSLWKRKSALLFISVFFIHFLGVFYSEYSVGAWSNLKIKLPLIIFPLVISTTKPISGKQLQIILHFFIVTIFISSIFSILALLGFTGVKIHNIRNISLFISHIRFSLLINVGIFSIATLFFLNDFHKNSFLKGVYVILLFWFITFLFILQSFTGIVVFFIVTLFLLSKWSLSFKNIKQKTIGILLTSIFLVVIFVYIASSVKKYYSFEKIDYSTIPKLTVKGNKYFYNKKSNRVENGHYVWMYVCEKELREEWNKRSKIKYTGKNKNGEPLKYSLIRYMTSKGLHKDAQGFSELTDNDIKSIENGVANYLFNNKFGIYPRLYQIIWEIDNYINGGNPSGHSVAQRIEYYKSAFNIIKNKPLFGVGTGDLKITYDKYYSESNSILSNKWRRSTHDEYLTLLIKFGIVGFIWIIFSFIYPIKLEKGFKNYFFFFFFIIAFLSMINEDTLETQTGVTFFAYFYSLFLFAGNIKLHSKE